MNLAGMKELTIGGINLRELSVDGVKVWQAGRLPAGYTEVEYIEATGTQYIDTGITGQNGLSVEFNFEALGMVGTDNSTIIGCTNSSNQRMYLTLNRSSSSAPFLWELGASNYYVQKDAAYFGKLNYKYNVNISWSKSASVLTVDGTAPINMKTLEFDDNNTNMYIFARNKGTSIDKYTHARLYDMKMWTNGTLVRDFIPVKFRDGTVGMFDLVTNAFFKNKGTGSFTAGGAV